MTVDFALLEKKFVGSPIRSQHAVHSVVAHCDFVTYRYAGRIQPVDATHWLNISAGGCGVISVFEQNLKSPEKIN